MCTADVHYDYVATVGRPVHDVDREDLAGRIGEVVARASSELLADGFTPENQDLAVSLDMKYVGQGFPIEVPLPEVDPDPAALEQQFYRLHEQAHGFASLSEPAEIVGVRVRARGLLASAWPGVDDADRGGVAGASSQSRPVMLPWTSSWADVPVIRRGALRRGERREGPLVVEQADTTTVIPGGCRVAVLEHGDLEITLPTEAP